MGMLDGKVALVTAAAKRKSIGFGIARALASEGASVVVTGRKKGQVNDAVRALGASGARACGLVVPEVIGDEEARAVAERALGEFGRLDVLVNCAQAAKSGVACADVAEGDLELALDTGAKSAFALMRACYPALRETRGSVINIGSLAAKRGQAGQLALAASKGALSAMSKVAAREWAADGIRVNVVSALVQTGGLAQWEKEDPALYKEFLDQIPAGRLADPMAELGRTCAFLASDEAAYITGQEIDMTGGVL